jgi:hypothetical protein
MMCSPQTDGLLRPAPICFTMADGSCEVVMAVTRGQVVRAASARLLVSDLVTSGPFERIS